MLSRSLYVSVFFVVIKSLIFSGSCRSEYLAKCLSWLCVALTFEGFPPFLVRWFVRSSISFSSARLRSGVGVNFPFFGFSFHKSTPAFSALFLQVHFSGNHGSPWSSSDDQCISIGKSSSECQSPLELCLRAARNSCSQRR